MIENLNSKLDSHENLTDEEMTHAINLMMEGEIEQHLICLLYTSPSPRD